MPKKKGKHLDYDDRCVIEDMLKHGSSFREIARRLNVSPSTVSNEIRRNRTWKLKANFLFDGSRRCIHYLACIERGVCGTCPTPDKLCKKCLSEDCYSFCKKFDVRRCPRLEKPPYVCNFCLRRAICEFGKTYYYARDAQRKHEMRASTTHAGIACRPAELEAMVGKVRALLEKGHSLEAIWAAHGAEMPVSVRTFYAYMDKGVMGLANIELPKKVRYRRRKEKKGSPRMALSGRRYSDWEALGEQERISTVQMDTIEGTRSDRKAVLSLHFSRLLFQIYVLLPAKTQACVIAAMDALEAYCEGEFGEVFGIILTDRGSEFLNYEGMEASIEEGHRRCRVFYCDPMKPAQKGACERNHVEYRKIVPKGTSIDSLTQAGMALICSHVNSYPRAARRQAPIKLARIALPQSLLENLGIEEIPSDEVIMTPELLERARHQF